MLENLSLKTFNLGGLSAPIKIKFMYSLFLRILAYALIALVPAVVISILMTRSFVKHYNSTIRYAIKETFNSNSLELLISVIAVVAYIASFIDVKLIQELPKSASDALIIINLVTISVFALAIMRIVPLIKKL